MVLFRRKSGDEKGGIITHANYDLIDSTNSKSNLAATTAIAHVHKSTNIEVFWTCTPILRCQYFIPIMDAREINELTEC